jgi:photosystem I subunit 3
MAASVASKATTLSSAFIGNKELCSVKTTRASVFVSNVNRARTVCSAEKSVGKAASAIALAAAIAVATPQIANADVAGLTPCKDSKAFAKREKKEVSKLQSRLKNYEEGSAPALALQASIDRTHARFEKYGKQGLLCGTDGLPHLIVDGDQAHLSEFVFPGLVFLYIAGWIGWVGREYLIAVKSTAKKPTEKEIIIDVPLALKLTTTGLTWPIAAVSALRNGSLIVPDSKITVSPR